jgi:alkanesulfonate monooxygenase SsuD/methylene tetrahydromethanopterin reductase-like flavin-dependent oxidoreductase (luciferase family)
MRLGVQLFMSNYQSWAKATGNAATPEVTPDATRMQEELHLVDLAEELGFDSVWSVEHHFSPYALTGNPTQLLSYIAGRTRRVDLGADVIVLPWHDPLEIAGSIATLDNLLAGRRLTLGFGRGNSPREFGPFRIPYEESRVRMMEALDIIRMGLTRDVVSYDGEIFKIPEVSIRPRPLSPDLTENMMMVWASPESLEGAATSGLCPLITNFSGWEKVRRDLVTFNGIREESGWAQAAPTIAVAVYCDENGDLALAQGEKYWRQAVSLAAWHYDQAANPDFLPKMSGEEKAAFLDKMYEKQVAGGFFGTPEFLIERLSEEQRAANVAEFIVQFSFGDMPLAETERSMRLFADRVLPALQELPATASRATPWHEVERVRSVPSVGAAAD